MRRESLSSCHYGRAGAECELAREDEWRGEGGVAFLICFVAVVAVAAAVCTYLVAVT